MSTSPRAKEPRREQGVGQGGEMDHAAPSHPRFAGRSPAAEAQDRRHPPAPGDIEITQQDLGKEGHQQHLGPHGRAWRW